MADRSIEITFREQVQELRSSDKRSVLISKEEYCNLIEELKAAAACGNKTKTPKQYYILKRYEVLQCGDVEKLIKKRTDVSGAEQTLYYSHIDELFDIVKRAHTSTGMRMSLC